MPRDSRPVTFGERLTLSVKPPYRLDLTVAVLRRSPKNTVDVVGDDGRYYRAIDGAAGPCVLRVSQHAPDGLTLELAAPPGETARLRALAIRMLGTERETPAFHAAARETPWLATLAHEMRGMRPPRYATLWETIVNAVTFQQISLLSAGAIVRRYIHAFGTHVAVDGLPPLVAFPTPAAVLAAPVEAQRATGQSAVKVATLQRVAEALTCGALDEVMLEERPTLEAIALLTKIKGIGPWTGAVVMMRGLGRLDIFPEKDSGLARSLRLASGSEIGEAAAKEIVASLRPEQGMLYFHLLLAILASRGELPSVARSRATSAR